MKTETFLDRSKWANGEWDQEPDRAEWKDELSGLTCLAKRTRDGHWCGYVGLPPAHPWHGKNYSDLEVSVHGGLTYAEECQHDDRPMRERVCHLPEPGEPEHLYWLGFDCAHLDDISPSRPRESGPMAGYRDLGYVRLECADVARQAHEAAKV